MNPRTAISWSGGKDSYLALRRSLPAFEVVALITMFAEDGARSRSHGLRPGVLRAQADRLGLPLVAGRGSWAGYEAGYRQAVAEAKALGITHVVFGDIMYESNRDRHVMQRKGTCSAFARLVMSRLKAAPTYVGAGFSRLGVSE